MKVALFLAGALIPILGLHAEVIDDMEIIEAPTREKREVDDDEAPADSEREGKQLFWGVPMYPGVGMLGMQRVGTYPGGFPIFAPRYPSYPTVPQFQPANTCYTSKGYAGTCVTPNSCYSLLYSLPKNLPSWALGTKDQCVMQYSEADRMGYMSSSGVCCTNPHNRGVGGAPARQFGGGIYPGGTQGFIPGMGGVYPGQFGGGQFGGGQFGVPSGQYPGAGGQYPGGVPGGLYPGGAPGGQYPGGAPGGQYPGGAPGGQYPGGAPGGQYPGGAPGGQFGAPGPQGPPPQGPPPQGGGGGGSVDVGGAAPAPAPTQPPAAAPPSFEPVEAEVVEESRPPPTSGSSSSGQCGVGRNKIQYDEDGEEVEQIQRITGEHPLRVAGGWPADRNEWPWIVMMMNRGRQFCDGSIIDEYHILTAAHCVAQMRTSDVASLKVRAGAHNLQNSASEAGVQDVGVKLVVKHKDFTMETLHSDIAILVLKSPIQYTNTVKPICLPSGKQSYAGKKGTVVGWGLLSERGSRPTVLQELTMEIWDNARCSSTYGSTAPAGIKDTMLCAGKKGKDSCSGDSGGPFVVPNGDHWEQIGVVSWGIGCGKDIYPGVYTRVTHMMDWINKVRRLYPN